MINKPLLLTIVIGTIIAMALSLGATIIMSVIALTVEIEDPERFGYKIGFVAASVYWLSFFFIMYNKLKNGTHERTDSRG